VITFVKDQAARLSPGRKKLLVTALRVFLRYLLHQGKIEMELADCVLPVASWSFSEVPKSLPPGTVQRVLAGHDRSTPVGRRNYAILLLLARLGLRAGEVVGLNLEDLDWDHASSASVVKAAAGPSCPCHRMSVPLSQLIYDRIGHRAPAVAFSCVTTRPSEALRIRFASRPSCAAPCSRLALILDGQGPTCFAIP
jgi:hypothetical protein